jgi:hypothetical protein
MLHRGHTRDAALRRQLIRALLELARHRFRLRVRGRAKAAAELG